MIKFCGTKSGKILFIYIQSSLSSIHHILIHLTRSIRTMAGSKKMAVAGVLVIMMVLIASASAVQDVITRDAYLNLLKKKPGLVVTKDVISNPLLEEAFLMYADRKLGGSVFNCGESCLGGKCNTPDCTCSFPLCTKNSLDEAN